MEGSPLDMLLLGLLLLALLLVLPLLDGTEAARWTVQPNAGNHGRGSCWTMPTEPPEPTVSRPSTADGGTPGTGEAT